MISIDYNPENYDGKIWWNENNTEMRELFGTQEDYDNFKKQGGTWEEYVEFIKSKNPQRFEKTEMESTYIPQTYGEEINRKR